MDFEICRTSDLFEPLKDRDSNLSKYGLRTLHTETPHSRDMSKVEEN